MSLPEFDTLLDMARNDPAGLEELRLKLTADILADARNDAQRKRLEGLVFKVNMERRRSSSPMGATIRLSELMCQSLADLQLAIVAPDELQVESDPSAAENVIAFPQASWPRTGAADEFELIVEEMEAGEIELTEPADPDK